MKNTFNHPVFEGMPVIGILRNTPHDAVMELLPRFLAAGLTTLEITLNSPDALFSIKEAAKSYGDRLNIGAGTVCSSADLQASLEAGATFIVTPVVEAQVIRQCKTLGIPVFPGAMTPTEVHAAWRLGATMVKLFPANSLGSSYVRNLLAPLSDIPLLATGGIGLGQMEQYWKAGVSGFGIGTPLFPETLIARRAWDAMGMHLSGYATAMTALMTTGKERARL